MVVSHCSTLESDTFRNNTMISKLLLTMPNGFDNFGIASESVLANEKILANINLYLLKEEVKLKK